jgi:hypothetical protein
LVSASPIDYSDFTSVSVFCFLVGAAVSVSFIMTLTLPVASSANVVIIKKVYLCYHAAEVANNFVYLAEQPMTPENAVLFGLNCIDLTQTVLFVIQVAAGGS